MSVKDAGLRIRVERVLREAFVSACLAENRTASDVLREFMGAYASKNPEGKQASLFPDGAAIKTGSTRKKD